ncbi:MAG TPA: RNA 2',3'-cyclic phosphodiesterase [Vicinamibacteria bacterium]|nr:RNA 2',3'-cyclic phosphodiesterase [Vicinamibacteria bacterium]
MSSAEPPRPTRIRSFVALELDAGVRERLGGLIERLGRNRPGIRWVRPESLHVTVRFLGYADPTALVRLQGPLSEIAARCPPADAPLRGLGLFPPRGRPRVLWLGIEVPPRIAVLREECEAAAAAAGFPPEPRPFRPHLTLGRWSAPAPRPRLPPADLGRARLERLVLFRSEMRRAGSLYTPLAAFDLGAHAV